MRNALLLAFIMLLCRCTDAQMLGAVRIIVPMANAGLIADGNSYVQGNGYTPFTTYIMASQPFNSNGATMLNYGVGGQTTEQMLSDQATQILPQLKNGVVNVLLLVELGNSIYYNGSAANAVATLKTYCNNARSYAASNGKTLRIIVSTTIHRDQTTAFGDNPAAYNAKLDEANALLVADPSFYDAVIRPDLEAAFATYTSGGYDADKVHPNNTGQTLLASLFLAKLTALQ